MPRIKNKQRADGRIQSKVYIGNGKYKYVYAYGQKELQKKIEEVKIQLGKGIDVTAERDTFEQWKDNWLKIKKSEISDKKYKSYEYRLKRAESLYPFQITKIRTMDIQNIITDNTSELSEYTLTSMKNIISQILQLAVDNRVMDYNPATAVKIPKIKKCSSEKRRALTDDEQKWVIDTPHRAQRAAMIMMYAGLRRGELIPLLWKDINLKNKTITVNKSVESVAGKLIVKDETKSEAGIRTVYIPQALVAYLSNQELDNNMLVCPDTKGRMMSDNAWKRLWESYIAELNLKYGDFTKIVDFEEKYCVKQKD